MELFWEKIDKRLTNLSEHMGNEQGCILFKGEMTKGKGGGYGIMKVKWPGSDVYKTEKAHRMAYMLHHKLTYMEIPRIDDNNNLLECSHLCHLKTCINPAHIVLEAHESNQGRITCKIQNKCHLGNHNPPSCLL